MNRQPIPQRVEFFANGFHLAVAEGIRGVDEHRRTRIVAVLRAQRLRVERRSRPQGDNGQSRKQP